MVCSCFLFVCGIIGCCPIPSSSFRTESIFISHQAFENNVSVLRPDFQVAGAGTVVRWKKGEKIIVVSVAHLAIPYLGTNIPNIFVLRTKDQKLPGIREFNIKKISQSTDVLILESTDNAKENGPFAQLAKEVFQGEPVLAIGSPVGETNVVSEGVVSKIDGMIILTNTEVFYGNSGGGLYNFKGELVGVASKINVATVPKGLMIVPNINIFIHIDRIRLALAF